MRNLLVADRLLFGFCLWFLSPRRLLRTAHHPQARHPAALLSTAQGGQISIALLLPFETQARPKRARAGTRQSSVNSSDAIPAPAVQDTAHRQDLRRRSRQGRGRWGPGRPLQARTSGMAGLLGSPFSDRPEQSRGMDLFRTESTLLRTHWVLVMMDQFPAPNRRLPGAGGEVDWAALCRMFNRPSAVRVGPCASASIRILCSSSSAGKPTCGFWALNRSRRCPLCRFPSLRERLIGTIRREYLDRMLSWNRMDLERRLELFKTYYNESRVHQSLEGATPEEKRRRSNRGAGQPPRLCLAKPLPWLIKIPVAA